MRDSHYRITLDITETQSQVSLPVKKGDTSRKIYINLVEGSHPYEIDGSKCSAVFHGVKSDGTKLQEYCIIEGDKIRYDFTEQTTAAVGLVECDITLHSIETGVIASPHFNIIVDNRAIEPDVLSEDQAITFDEVLTEFGDIRNAESGRVSAEEERVSNEQIRKTNEETRNANEEERIANEETRKKAAQSLANLNNRVTTAENERETAEEERQEAEKDRQAMWNNSIENPNVWELNPGCYYVSGMISISSYVSFPVYDNTILYIAPDDTDETKKRFVVFLGYAHGMPFDVLTGTTDGETEEFYIVETNKNKTNEITEDSTDEQYPSAQAVYELFSDIEIPEIPENLEKTDNKVKEITEKSTDEQYPSAKAVYDLNSNLFEQGKNLFNGVLEPGRANDSPNANLENESRSEWIAVEQGETYTFSHSKAHYGFVICGKLSDGTLIPIFDGKVYPEGCTFTIPEGVTHIRFSSSNTVLSSNNIQFEKGSEVTEYEPYTFTIKKDLLPTGGSAEIPENVETTDNKVQTIDKNSTETQYPSAKAVYDFVDKNQGNGGNAENSAFQVLPIGKNLLNPDTVIVGERLTESGITEAAASYKTTDFIPITENTEYCFSDNGGAGSGGLNEEMHRIIFYDAKQEKISYVSKIAAYPLTSPENAKYIRFSFLKAKSLPQFEQGNKITEYEAFNGANLIDGNKIGFVPKSITPKEVNFFSTKAGGKNLLDRTKSTIGYSFDSAGALVSSVKNETSDYIPVTYGDNIIVSGIPDTGYSRVYTALAMYDEFKNLIYIETYSANIPNPLTIPQNVKYIRYTYRKAGIDVQIERGTEATEYENFISIPCLKEEYLNFKFPKDFNYTENPWFGKRLVVDGDSITHDQGKYNYWQFIAAQLTDMYVDNTDITSQYASGWKGVGGSRIANELGANDPMYSIVLRYQNLPDDADLVMIAAGTNDWAHDNVLLGDFDSTDNTTFNGALNILLPGLKEKYPTIPVVMMTPIKRGLYGQVNKNGNTQEEFVDALIKKCRQYNVYCLDMWANCPINPNITAMEQLYVKPDGTNDKTHPNTEGHKIMGRTVAGFIRTLS